MDNIQSRQVSVKNRMRNTWKINDRTKEKHFYHVQISGALPWCAGIRFSIRSLSLPSPHPRFVFLGLFLSLSLSLSWYLSLVLSLPSILSLTVSFSVGSFVDIQNWPKKRSTHNNKTTNNTISSNYMKHLNSKQRLVSVVLALIKCTLCQVFNNFKLLQAGVYTVNQSWREIRHTKIVVCDKYNVKCHFYTSKLNLCCDMCVCPAHGIIVSFIVDGLSAVFLLLMLMIQSTQFQVIAHGH